jgi:subtilisin family serine protease
MGMRKLRWIIIPAVVFALAFGLVGQAVAANGQGEGGPGRYIVVFDGAVNEAAKESIIQGAGGYSLRYLPLINGATIWLPSQAVAEGLGEVVGVLRVEQDAIVYALPKPENPGKPPKKPAPQPDEVTPWGVDRIDADLAWEVSTGSGINVAIIDTGIDKDHPDLVDNIMGGVNFVKIKGKIIADQWDDDNGHGTHCAGIVAAVDNDIGVIGVAPEAYLYGVKVLDRRGSGYVSDVILGIQWSIEDEMDVISMSLGTSSDVQSLHDACDAAYAAGIVVVAAAGNSGDTDPDDDVIYPAKYSSVIAVAATDDTNTRASWSGDGPEVELAAPGVAIYSTWKGGEYDTKSGTSMAAPHVAGTAALVLAANPGLNPDDVRATLQAAADDLGAEGFDNYYGHGLVDAEQAATGVETQ